MRYLLLLIMFSTPCMADKIYFDTLKGLKSPELCKDLVSHTLTTITCHDNGTVYSLSSIWKITKEDK